MITIRPSNERGHIRMDWLDTKHSFSFGQYYDPRHMGFRELRVINEDIIAPGQGFPSHEHNDMEIITYILEGKLEHKDSMGTGSTINAGEVQYMCAGTGVHHSEFNPSNTNSVHLLQIWIFPDKTNYAPHYAQKDFSKAKKVGDLIPIINNTGSDGAIAIHQDAKIYIGEFKNKEAIEYPIDPERSAWIQVTRGSVIVNGKQLNQGDGAAISEETEITIAGNPMGEILLFDLS